MASILIRDLDETVKDGLRKAAAEHGRSMEAEARAILSAAVGNTRPERGLGTRIHQRFGRKHGVDLEIPPREDPARAADFEG